MPPPLYGATILLVVRAASTPTGGAAPLLHNGATAFIARPHSNTIHERSSEPARPRSCNPACQPCSNQPTGGAAPSLDNRAMLSLVDHAASLLADGAATPLVKGAATPLVLRS